MNNVHKIILSIKQEEAIELALKWMKGEYKSNHLGIFTIAGYAGTGKSTIVKELITKIGLEKKNVAYCTFTGKAALVLTRKGNPATTLHKLIYDPVEVVEDIETKMPSGEILITKKKKIKFEKKIFLDIDIKLIVVDEVSMVSKKLLEDLKSFGIKIIAIGDPGQLQPVQGEDNGLLANPDVFLDEVHRQAADNPIIQLSMMARKGIRIKPGMYGDKVAVIHKHQLTPKMLLSADQVLCGKNDTREELNKLIRKNLGFKSDLPSKGDKIICRKNNWNILIPETPLINGLIGYVKEDIHSVKYSYNTFTFDFRPEFTSDYFEGIKSDMTIFLEGFEEYKKVKYDIRSNHFDFGYAITVHASQGSEWEKVLVYNEMLNPKDYSKWLYTAITRASDKLILVL